MFLDIYFESKKNVHLFYHILKLQHVLKIWKQIWFWEENAVQTKKK